MATVKLDPAKGIQIPNLTTTERNAISSPETGAIIWNTTTSEINQYNGSAWEITYTDTSVAGITSAADATAITIDSNEQVTMGGTTLYAGQGNTATGQHFENTGTGYLSRTGGYALGLNRNTSDGTIINFARQGSSVGSIDASTSGISIKLGGTAAANALDDYEEGTFTVGWSSTNNSFNPSTTTGYYTKVGNLVTVTYQAYLAGAPTIGTAANGFSFTGLPFTSSSGRVSALTWGHKRWMEWPANTTDVFLQIPASSTTIETLARTGVGEMYNIRAQAFSRNGSAICFTGHYYTNS